MITFRIVFHNKYSGLWSCLITMFLENFDKNFSFEQRPRDESFSEITINLFWLEGETKGQEFVIQKFSSSTLECFFFKRKNVFPKKN